MKKKLIFLFIFLILVNQVPAQSVTKDFITSSLKAMGAPNNPKVEIAWNRYYDWQEIGTICSRLAQAHPNLIHHGSIGKSVQNRELYLLTVTNFKKGDSDRKPAMYIDGNIHSNEIQGAEVALYTAWFLVESYGHIDWISELLDEKTCYIIPTINPDARDFFIHSGNTPHSPRSGMMPRDDDGDGLVDEDGYDDLDGDGNIVRMRKRDANGRWREDPDNPGMMIHVKPDEKGEFTILGMEGFDNDGDGLVNEDGPGYYDPNRNWGWNWQPAYVEHGGDQYPFSIPENRAVADFVLAHENIGGAQSYHNSGGMIIRGPGSASDDSTYHHSDQSHLDFLAQLGEEMLPGYRYYVLYKDMYTAYGSELDWFYGARGIFAFTNELWTFFDYFRRDQAGTDDWFGRQADIYRFNRLLLFGEGIVAWKKVKHPQFGDIEIGGVKKAWTRTAPSFLIEDMCHRNMAFTLFHAYHLPQISIDSVAVKDLPGGLQQIDVMVKNNRVLPTRSAHEIQCMITPPDYLKLTGVNIKVLAGFIVTEPLLDLAWEQKYKPWQLAIDAVPGMATVQARWLVVGKAPYNVEFNSNKGGLVRTVIGK